MSKSRPRWDYRAEISARPIPDALWDELKEILDTDTATFEQFAKSLRVHLGLYRTLQHEKKGPGPEKMPTPGELRAAARELQENAWTLAGKLGGEIGGLRAFMNSAFYKLGDGSAIWDLRERLENDLYLLHSICRHLLTYELAKIKLLGDPRKHLVGYVALLFHDVLNERPSSYLKVDPRFQTVV